MLALNCAVGKPTNLCYYLIVRLICFNRREDVKAQAVLVLANWSNETVPDHVLLYRTRSEVGAFEYIVPRLDGLGPLKAFD